MYFSQLTQEDDYGALEPSISGKIMELHHKNHHNTGKVTVLRYTAVQDVGTAIHPSYVEGQIQGGVAQGLGMALTEEYFFDDRTAACSTPASSTTACRPRSTCR